MSSGDAVITQVLGTPTHDGEPAFSVVLTFPGGGQSRVLMSGVEAAAVARRAGVNSPDALVGLSWSVLQFQPANFSFE
jgi:hypothetical protein